MDIEITPRQAAFIRAEADEVLFGGAAGGGKSYGQLIDAFLFALKYAGSKQLMLRRTYPELEKSLIRVSYDLYPREVYSYNRSGHVGRFRNGSILDFGYCDSESDVYKYQSAEYDVIRFDELTHFTEQMYLYLISRVRGANDFPKHVKSSTNPGSVGHQWVKKRFITIGAPDVVHSFKGGTRLFLPSRVQDNRFLLEHDPEYIRRLENLSERDRKALLYGSWDITDGQYFSEWDEAVHVCEPFPIPEGWRRYVTMDYGLDMLAAYCIALDGQGRAYVYREHCESGLIVSEAARAVAELAGCAGANGCAGADGGERIEAFFAPPDMWNRRQETGKSVAELFAEQGVYLAKANNDRVQGWYNVKEWLRPRLDVDGEKRAGLVVFRGCEHLIESMPALLVDPRNPNDVADEPHEYTHGPDAIRYFLAGRPRPAEVPLPEPHYAFSIFKPDEPVGREKIEAM